jgi:hypothetical protein
MMIGLLGPYCLISGAIHSATPAAQFRTHAASSNRLSAVNQRSNTGGFFSVCRMGRPCFFDDGDHLGDVTPINPLDLFVEDRFDPATGPFRVQLGERCIGSIQHVRFIFVQTAMADDHHEEIVRNVLIGFRKIVRNSCNLVVDEVDISIVIESDDGAHQAASSAF